MRDQWLYCDVWINVILWWVLEFKSLWRLSIDNVLFHLTCIYVKAFMFWILYQKLSIVKVDIKMIVWKTVYWKWLWFNFHEFVSRFWKDAWTFIFQKEKKKGCVISVKLMNSCKQGWLWGDWRKTFLKGLMGGL